MNPIACRVLDIPGNGPMDLTMEMFDISANGAVKLITLVETYATFRFDMAKADRMGESLQMVFVRAT
jgi:hypothetical protein